MVTSWRLLGLSVLIGVILQALMLAFGLHASLALARLTGDSTWSYWALLGAYFVLGFSIGLSSIPWATPRLRFTLAVALIVVASIWSAWFHDGAT